jgi:hypothetical protein
MNNKRKMKKKKKLKKTEKDGKISHVHGWAELISLKWLYYQEQSIYSVQSPSKFQ